MTHEKPIKQIGVDEENKPFRPKVYLFITAFVNLSVQEEQLRIFHPQ